MTKEPKEKQPPSSYVKCPKCGGEYTRQGLPGHLRFTHGTAVHKQGAPAPRPVEKVVVVPTVGEVVKELTAELEDVRDQRAKLEAKLENWWARKKDEAVEELIETLKAQEAKILSRIRELRGKLTT